MLHLSSCQIQPPKSENLALILTLCSTSIKATLLSQTNLQTFQVSTLLEILGATKVSLLILTPYLVNFPDIPKCQACAPELSNTQIPKPEH